MKYMFYEAKKFNQNISTKQVERLDGSKYKA
ncbi:hypothetical protein JIY74_30995 [Vibrio harveyi]|nr:hypothetical protein [Vibrio harveyi]